MPNMAIVRAYGGEPRRCVVISAENGLLYVSSERAALGETADFPPPIGVAADDVFAFEDEAFIRLREAWGRWNRTSADEWKRLRHWQQGAVH